MIPRIRPGTLISWCCAALSGAVLALGAAALFRGGSADDFHPGKGLLQMARADVGKGDYLFFPNRMTMWVVNRTNGKIIHYTYRDNQLGTVKGSRISAIRTDWFPPRDTDYILSDRNLTSLLWVVNRVTGDFQVWRASSDETLSTDQLPVPAGEDLQGEASPPTIRDDRGAAVPPRRTQAPAEAPSPAPAKRRSDSKSRAKNS